MLVKVSSITIANRKRKVNPEKIKEISESIKEIGLIHPIVLHEKENRLIAGLHRFEAVKLLGWTHIEAILINHNDLDSELIEIDENLCREDLHYLDRGNFLKRRKEIYEEKYPETISTKEGGPFRGNQYTKVVKTLSVQTTDESKNFVEETSKKTGISKTTIKEDIQLANELIPEVQEMVKELDIPKKEALALARLEDEEQKEIVEKFAVGKAESIFQAIKTKKMEDIKKGIEEQAQANPNKPTIWKKDIFEQKDSYSDEYDLLLTDPPYSTEIKDIKHFASGWLFRALFNVSITGRAYIFIGAYPDEIYAYIDAWYKYKNTCSLEHLELAQVLVWTYRNTLGPSPSYDYKQNWQAILYFRGKEAKELDCPLMTEQFSVQDVNAPDGRFGIRYHAWQKPNELAERLIRHSTKTGDTVFDPFAGTGTFLLAANRLGRKGFGYEMDDEMLKIAKDRGCEIKENENEIR
jgi:ParB-like chromosome segregation protein Spo0J